MAAISEYHVLVYGSPGGYQTNRAQIACYDANHSVVAYIRFNDPGMVFENDSIDGNGRIYMHLPSHMFTPTLDLLRNEKPMHIYFAQNRGFLGTASTEPVGEGES